MHDGRYMLFLVYAELYLGFYDLDRSGVWGDSREDGGSDQCRSGFRRRRSIIVYYDDRCDGFVGGTYGDCTEVRPDRETDPRDTAFYQISVSADSRGTSGQGVYRDEPDRKCAGAGVGLHAGGALSYYNDRLKNPLRNQGFPPNLVLMKKCSFASKHF